MKKNALFASAGLLLLTVAAVVSMRVKQRRTIKTLWEEATAELHASNHSGEPHTTATISQNN